MYREVFKRVKWRIFHVWISIRIYQIRKKDRIRVGFLLQELTQWKSEYLYKVMLVHSRFDPVLCISPSLGYPGAENILVDYCKKKGYDFVWIDARKTLAEQVHIDIAIPEKPYQNELHELHQVDNNKRIPYAVIPYYMSTITEEWVVNQRLNLLCWRQFVDNECCKEEWSKIHRLKGLTYAVTGLPVMDELLTPRSELQDVWPVTDERKRIIYAPHHTIADFHWQGIGYSTFLDYCDVMLDFRDQFKDDVYFVFKPHPSLHERLIRVWGEERTNAYYKKWEEPGISHVEQGDYLALFKHSDAMIHDCGSFTVEYMYTGNPVMYLVRDDAHADNMIPYAREAFDLHVKGKNVTDIKRFIEDVIDGNDPLREKRSAFKQRYLLPPNGRSACENIIHSILGDE